MLTPIAIKHAKFKTKGYSWGQLQFLVDQKKILKPEAGVSYKYKLKVWSNRLPLPDMPLPRNVLQLSKTSVRD